MNGIYKNLFFMLCISIVLWSCSKDPKEPLQNLKDKQMAQQDFFGTVAGKDIITEENKVLFITYQFNAQDETITLLSATEARPSGEIAWDTVFGYDNKPSQKSGYVVHCDKDGKVWEKKCEGYDCFSLVKKCLGSGGCAQICNANMVYVPQTKVFYLSDDLNKLIDTKGDIFR